MYHPDALQTIAHRREAELVAEAQHCGIPTAEAAARRFTVHPIMIVMVVTIIATVTRLFVS